MRQPEEILSRVRGMLCVELDRRLEEASKRLPHLCQHNHRQPLDERPTVDGDRNSNYNRIALPMVPTIGLCMLGAESPDDWGGTICEEPLDAQRCPVFESARSKQEVLADFRRQVSDADWLSDNMPEVSGLLWAAGATAAPKLPLWKRFFVWFTRIRIEPVYPVVDLTPLLPSVPTNETIRS